MHLYLLTRGIKHKVDKFINELSAKYLPLTHRGQKKLCQVAVRPIQMWEVVFPEAYKDTMFTSLWGRSVKNNGFAEHQKRYKKFIWPLRKLLGAKRMDDTWKDAPLMAVDGNGVQKIAIGLRDDQMKEFDPAPKTNEEQL